MVRRSGYAGATDPTRRFEGMRAPMARLRALELAQSRPSPAGVALDHAIVSIRMAANLLTQEAEFFDLSYQPDEAAYAKTVAEFDAMRPMVHELTGMVSACHPGTPEYRTLSHALAAMRMAADVLTGRPDFFRLVSSDFSSPTMRTP